MKTKKLATLAVTVAVAMILSFVESRIPAFVAIPGVKVGLANIAVIFALYKLGWREALSVSLVRVVLVALLFGSVVSLAYSIAGAVLSLSLMILLRKIGLFTEIAVSVVGGITHNIGQIFVAFLLLESDVVFYYLPFLLISGIIAGIAVGAASALLIKRIKI
ncbi:MAG: Gx transporter family protein [Clostridia bacterium]|nr:Gx transporter family protein [Clostridia bacterium]